MKYFILLLIAAATIAACKTVGQKMDIINEDMAVDLMDFSNALYPVAVKGKWGYMNNKMEIVIPPQFYKAEDFSEGFAVITMEIGTSKNEPVKTYQGYIDTTGNIVIACRYDRALLFSEGLAVVARDGKYGFVDKTGKEIIPLIYEDASGFSEGLAVVKLDGKNGFVDPTGRMVIPPQFERACWVSDFNEGLSAVYTSENAGYIDKTGKMVIPAIYSYVSSFSEGMALVQPAGNSKYGYINMQGEMVIEPQYDMSLPFYEGIATVKFTKPDGNSIYRIIDKNGKMVADNLNYAFVGIFREGLAGVESFNHQWGFIDKTGKEVVAPTFAGVRLFRNGLSRMESGSLFKGLKVVYINKAGKIVWQE